MKRRTAATGTLVGLWLLGGLAARADPPVTPATLVPCPFTAEEIEAELGIDVDNRQAAEMTFPGSRDVGCTYATASGNTTVSVRQTWDPSEPGATSTARGTETEAGFTAVAGDPDGAQWRRIEAKAGHEHGPGRGVEMRYRRDRVDTVVIVRGPTLDPLVMEPRLARLRRVP